MAHPSTTRTSTLRSASVGVSRRPGATRYNRTLTLHLASFGVSRRPAATRYNCIKTAFFVRRLVQAWCNPIQPHTKTEFSVRRLAQAWCNPIQQHTKTVFSVRRLAQARCNPIRLLTLRSVPFGVSHRPAATRCNRTLESLLPPHTHRTKKAAQTQT